MGVFACSLLSLLLACGTSPSGPAPDAMVDAPLDVTPPLDAGPETPSELRIRGAAVVDLLAMGPEVHWLEERLAPIPAVEGDRDPGPRALVRTDGPDGRRVVWEGEGDDRLIDVAIHPSGEWTASGVSADRRLFLVRGDRDGALLRAPFDDETLPEEPGAWRETPPDALRVTVLGEGSVRVLADGEDAVVTLTNDHAAVLAYRVVWREGSFQRGPRTVITPAAHLTPFLPIGGSYDVFDAMWSWFLPVAAIDGEGSVFVATFANRTRFLAHNAHFGTDHRALQTDLSAGLHPSDVLVVRVDRDGSHAWSRVVGTSDVDDEVYGIAVNDGRIAVVGRSRRELGLDNSEWHAMIAQLDREGAVGPTTTWDGADSVIAQAAAFDDDGALFVGGTEAYRQNPSGFSLFDEGQPFLLHLSGDDLSRRSDLLMETSGHAELRAVVASAGGLWLAGSSNGPLTHTGDADPSRVVADGWWRRASID